MAWVPVMYWGFEELSIDIKKMASAKRLIPCRPFGNSITGSEEFAFIVLTVASISLEEVTVEPPTMIAVVPNFCSSPTVSGSDSSGFSGSMRAR